MAYHRKGEITNVVIDSTSRITGTTAQDAQYRIAWDAILGSGRYKMNWKFIEIPTIPNAPTNLRSTVLSSSTTSVIFTPVAGATSYIITSSPSGFTGTGASSPITVSGLAPNTIYTFTATATDIVGTSIPSLPSVAITTSPSPPTNIVGTALSTTSISVAFTPPTGGNGTITSYTVTSSPSNLTFTGASSPIIATGLTSNTAYTFTVIATNSGGASTYNFRVKSLTAYVPLTVDGYALNNSGVVQMVNDATRGYVFNLTGGNFLSLNQTTPVNSTKSFWLSSSTPTTNGGNVFSTTKMPIWFNFGTFLKASPNFPSPPEIFSTIQQTATWLFYTITTTATTTTMYVNGTQVATANVTWTGDNATMFFGAYASGNFLTARIDDIRFYSSVLTPTEIATLYTTNSGTTSASSTASASITTFTSFQQLLITKPPWGRYSASSWNQGTLTLTDETGNGRHGVGAGTISQTTASGNGATVSIPYIQGITTDTILFPAGSIATAHTICCVSRYASGINQQRIFASQTDNVIIGHQLSRRGIIYNGSFKTNTVTTPPTLDWLNLVYTNGSNSIPNNVLVNGVGIGTSSGGNGIVSRLSVNLVGVYPAEISDFQIAQLLIWDVVLTPAEMVIVSNAYTQFLSTGILS